jgi:hypothetical protein
MKKHFLCAVVISLSQYSNAQITITSQDIAPANSNFRVSIAQNSPLINPVQTGANYLWDFSFLQPVSQEIDSIRTVTSTGTTYALFFADVSFNTNRSNQAKEGGVSIPSLPIGGGVTVSDPFSFFYRSSTLFQQTGIGATINGFGTPIGFNNKDVIYRFPMNYGDTDTSASDYNINIPNVGYYGHDQVRISEVDGWGTLITPFGTFNTLRIKSSITGNDTLFADTLGFGFSFPSAPVTEYKWLAPQGGIPILQITITQGQFGGASVTRVVYRDSLRSFTALPDMAAFDGSVKIYPNPASDVINFDLEIAKGANTTIRLTDINGKVVYRLFEGFLNTGRTSLRLDLDRSRITKGVYVAEILTESGVYRSALVIGE